MKEDKANPTIVIGLDGGTWDRLRPWMDAHKLPTFDKLCRNGVHGVLRSTIPTNSAANWPSIYTGKNPAKHGVFDFVNRGGLPVNATSVRSKRVWDLLSETGHSCCIINAPLTYPVTPLIGCMISSWLSPRNSANTVYPPRLTRLLEGIGYKLHPDFTRYTRQVGNFFKEDKKRALFSKRDDVLAEVREILDKRLELLEQLIGDNHFDFVMVVYTETDLIQHLFWNSDDKLLDVWQKVDSQIGKILQMYLNLYPKVFIVSDHGFHASPNVGLNPLGLFKRSRKSRFWHIIDVVRPLLRTLAEKVPAIYHMLSRRVEPPLSACSYGMHIDESQFETSKEYESFRTFVINTLANLKLENGKTVFKKVMRREEVYEGARLNLAPDVVYLPQPEIYVDSTICRMNDFWIDDVSQHRFLHEGNHIASDEGMFLAYGSNIREGLRMDCNVYDILPTILYGFGVPIPSDIDGKVLSDIFEDKFTKDRLAVCGDAASVRNEPVSGDDRQEIMERLKALGYI